MRKRMLLVLVILGAVLCLAGCRPETMRIDVNDLHEGVWLVTMVKLSPEDRDYDDNDTVIRTDNEYTHLKGTMIDLYCQDGWRCAECHLRNNGYISLTRYVNSSPDGYFPLSCYEGDSGMNRLARRFGSMRIAAIDIDGRVLKISNEVSFFAKDRYAVAGSGSYDYEANSLVLRYDVRRELWGIDLLDLSGTVFIISLLTSLMLLAACVPKSFRVKAGKGAVILFAALSLPNILLCVLFIIDWLPWFTPEGAQRLSVLRLLGKIWIFNFLWIIDLALFFLGKYETKKETNENEE